MASAGSWRRWTMRLARRAVGATVAHAHSGPTAVVVGVPGRSAARASLGLAVAASAATVTAIATLHLDREPHHALHCESAASEPVEGGYKENPIQHVAALLRLYDEIDRNMEVLTGRMLDELQQRIEKEKKANDGKLRLSPEQIALNMSIEFESTLEKVQDAVFRNNYVTKEQVQDALQRLARGELRGSGARGQLTVQEAEAIEGFVKQLGRMRWKVTGSREPLIPTHGKSLIKDEKPAIPLSVVIEVMEQLIPRLTAEMEAIVRDVRETHTDRPMAEQQQLISRAYIKRSGELTEELCAARKLDLQAFQAAMVFYHDNPAFEDVLARLSAEQQRRFTTLGL